MLSKNLVQESKNNSILIANYMLEQATIDGKYFAYSDNEKMLYCYDGKIYIPFEGIDLDRFFHDFLVQFDITGIWKSSRLSEMERAIKVNNLVPRVEMDDYDDMICFKNGILNFDTMEFVNHSHKYFFSTYVDVNYDPNAGSEPQIFLQALEKIFFNTKKQAPDYETIDFLQCVGGSLIFPKNKLRQLYMFLGGGANGKSILMNVFGMFFSKDHTTYLSLEELSTKNSERSRLLKSRINFCSEEKGAVVASEEIKRIVYGEGITIRRKFKEAVEFIPKTKIVVAANTRPKFSDTSYGFERRLTVINFDNMFVKPDKYYKIIEPEVQGIFLAEDDDVLIGKLMKEKTQILNFFLLGLKKLKNNKWVLQESEAISETKKEYIESNDNLGTWLKDNYFIDEGENYVVSTSDVLDKYRRWYHDNVSTSALNLATSTIGVRIGEIFRVKGVRKSVKGVKCTLYPLIEKKYYADDDNQNSGNNGSESGMGNSTQNELPGI